jgi:benzoyl-CoA 2,3-epoxidase subunit B
MSAINYSEKIPNNVDLGSDRTLQRALEQWQPNFINWWDDMSPEGTTDNEVYLRTAVSVDPQGWAQFGHVKMRDYRWGIFLNQGEADRTIHFGDHKGEKAWQDVPGEHRANLRRIIVTQGDTEPASVEQQRHLGKTAPSMYDLRNLFQINVEEGRHLWAMVYLLHKHFGRDGREEAEALLERRSGQEDNPRILQAFNEETPDWLSFFMFTYFTDRDGKYQLASLAESGFDPLSRSCRFMLTEEAHHMFVGETGVGRILQRTCELMKEHKTDDVRTNAANYYTQGVKGRFLETRIDDDHLLTDASYEIDTAENGLIVKKTVPALQALNERLRQDYIEDCAKGLLRWNKAIERAGIDFEMTLPHRAFNRRIGAFAGLRISPDGRVLSEAEWKANEGKWLPTDEDRAYVTSLMGPAVVQPGKYAHWIAPPARGINNQASDFEYVRFN